MHFNLVAEIGQYHAHYVRNLDGKMFLIISFKYRGSTFYKETPSWFYLSFDNTDFLNHSFRLILTINRILPPDGSFHVYKIKTTIEKANRASETLIFTKSNEYCKPRTNIDLIRI